ncbi:hypothetical protein DFP72DRAFT_1162916 [Ephemerocybe angulata]|uniref:Uncharacterized protein n=1 Tax=Ephemerocybe angulata TaxID=980116 RepID=A0A8H6MD90_9AGAR|nr:hypothetical protein DFP72DRAFT_1162916 [Tulosesus angulatus]
MSTRKMLRRFILPLTIFPVFTTLVFKFLTARIHSGMDAGLKAQCEAPDSPYALSYTGFPKVDARLCGIVAVFQTTMSEPAGLQFLYYGLGSGAILFLFPYLEASRARKTLLLAFPIAWILFAQVATIAFTLSIYLPLFILTGSHDRTKKREDGKITRAHAESLFFAVIVGYFVPSFGMLILKDPEVTALWQIFPVIMSVAAGLHLLIRRPSKLSAGSTLIQVVLMGIFIIASSTHFATIWPIIGDYAALKTLFLPSLLPLPASTSTGLLALDFLKWDLYFAFTSLSVATLWFTSTTAQFFGLLAWYAVAVPMSGPGAAITGALIWREAQL